MEILIAVLVGVGVGAIINGIGNWLVWKYA